MYTRNTVNSKVLFMALLLLVSAAGAFGQEAGPPIHRLSWQPVEYVSGYEVIVELQTQTNIWIELTRRINVHDTWIDLPLFLGSYRFRVTAYDLLGNPGASSEWIYFEVISRDTPEESPSDPDQTNQTIVYQERAAAPEEEEKTIYRLEIVFQPIIILPFSDFNEIYATSPVQPLGFALRFSVMPLITEYGVFGLEFSPSWNYLANDILITSRYTHIINTHLSVIWQIRPFNRSSAINTRLGIGLTYLKSRFDFDEGRNVHNLGAWNSSITIGVSYIYFLDKQFFINAGMDYFHIFARDNRTTNYLRPFISLGWWI